MKIYVVCQEDDAGLACIPIAFTRTKERAEKWIVDATSPGGEYDYMRRKDYWVEDRELIDE